MRTTLKLEREESCWTNRDSIRNFERLPPMAQRAILHSRSKFKQGGSKKIANIINRECPYQLIVDRTGIAEHFAPLTEYQVCISEDCDPTIRAEKYFDSAFQSITRSVTTFNKLSNYNFDYEGEKLNFIISQPNDDKDFLEVHRQYLKMGEELFKLSHLEYTGPFDCSLVKSLII